MPDLKQTVVWVAVPNGYTDETSTTLRLSVIAYPRLFVLENGQPASETVPLRQFQDFLQWPGRSEGVQFTVQFGDSTSVKAKRVERKPDLTSWQLLFDRDTPVECYTQPETTTESTLAYPAAAMYQLLKEQVQLAGQGHPWSAPLAEQVARNFSPIAKAIFGPGVDSPLLHSVYDSFRGGTDPKGYIDDQNAAADPARDWLLTKLFFRPPQITLHDADSTASYTNPDPTDPGEGTSTEPEFHKLIALLSFHPDLLRLYGLVMDLEVEKPANWTADSYVRLIPKWNPTSKVETADAAPITHFSHTTFLPRPRAHNPEDLADDAIDLTTDRYQVIQADLDSGLLSLQKLVERLSTLAGERITLPQLASGGLILIRKSAAQRLVEQRKRFNSNYAVRLGDPGQLEVYAEDLLFGYRLDVWSDRVNRWHSLHRRNATYKFTRNSKPVIMEFTNEGWINPTFGELTDGLVSENLLSPFLGRWTGWSLSAVQEPEDEVEVDANMKFGVQHTVVSGSLPWLRFGITYRLRMRTVNLAGNGPAFTADGSPDLLSTPALTYRRFEPVKLPLVIPRTEPVAELGESVPRLVIRDTEPDQVDERHIAPPQTTVDLCEQHGLFDVTNGIDPAKLEEAEEREERQVPGVEAGDDVTVDYLPDHVARGASLIGVPGASGPVKIDFGSAWPERRSFRLKVAAGTGAPVWSAGDRVLTVYLAPAQVARVQLSSYFSEGDLDTMALWHWMAEGLSGSELMQMRQGILDGRHWAITPGTDLVLVHAVKQPLQSPDFDRIGALRGEGDTAATFSGIINVDGASTGKVEVNVQWVEPVDDPDGADEPEFIGGAGYAFEARVGSPDTTTLPVESAFDFRDTKYRKVQVTATGITRFTDFFGDDETLTREGNPIEVDVLNTARPAAPRIQYVVPTFGWEQPPARSDGTISRTRWGGGLRVYLDRPWYSSGDGEMLAVILYDESRNSFFRRPEPSDQVKPWVTLWGSDPIWKSGDTYAYPKLEHFKSALATQTGLTLAGVLGEEVGLQSVPLLVAGHSVKYDSNSGRWYCDIELDAGPTYFPFIRLALARFQPRSVAGAHLSPIVTTDIVQTAPHRTATVTRDATRVSVALSGQTYMAGRAGGAAVRVSAEKSTAHSGMLAWTQENVTLTQGGSPTAYATLKREGLVWTGSFYLPSAPSAADPYRLVVREYERYLSDSGVAERLVYADMIQID